VMPSGRLVVTRDNAKSIRSMHAMFITPWYSCTGCFGRSGCNDDLPLVIGGGSVGLTVASEVLDAMFLVRRNLAGDWEPAIKGKMGD
jgi:hypothetical protein